MSKHPAIHSYLLSIASEAVALQQQRFFKTGPAQYAEKDIFIGIHVPQLRRIAKQYQQLGLSEIKHLLCSAIHEERLLALLILVHQFKNGDDSRQTSIYQLYLKHVRYINNWDLVDTSAPPIIGAYLQHKDKSPLFALAKSQTLWKRRIAIMATLHFIKNNEYDYTLRLVTLFLNDDQDLIHKASGWMLREIGKRNLLLLKDFLNNHYQSMPRTMLRYAIEKFTPQERKQYLR